MQFRCKPLRIPRFQVLASKRSANRLSPKLAYQTLESKVLLAADFHLAGDSLALTTTDSKILMAQIASTDEVWKSASNAEFNSAEGTNYIQASQFSLYDLDETALQELLDDAPLEFTPGYLDNAVVLSVPTPNQSFEQFAIVESPIMEPALAAQFPDIKTYRGVGIDNAGESIRLDFTPQGFHAAIRSAASADYYVDPYFHLSDGPYMSYYTHDQIVDPLRATFDGSGFLETRNLTVLEQNSEGVNGVAVPNKDGALGHRDRDPNSQPDNSPTGDDYGLHGGDLRTYQLAVAATGEYTAFHGGTVALGQAAIVTAVNRVVGIYEIEVAVRMVLVGNNSDLVYTSSGSDPYTNSNGVAMLSQNQSNVDAVIGSANYDVGHVFSTGGGGVASLGVIGQNGAKARGVTGLGSPIGDPFYVDFVAHELGHQYGGNHTFNGDSGNCAGGNRTGSTAYEPGSGSTIMAYAGICGNDDLQRNSDAFFHSESIDQIRVEVTTGTGNSSATITSTGNSIPTVNAGANYVIPDQTPFELTAVGSDADSGDVLTYSWEQRDLGPQRDVNASDNGSSPIFRAWHPTTDATRVFPRMAELLINTTAIGEQLPTTNWNSMDFRVVVRDNAAGGGGVNTDDMSVQVVNAGGGFAVTSQNTNTSWVTGETETITWNVAGTTGNGINTANVDIFFAADGVNYDTVLATGVANDGSHDITVPNVSTSLGRIKVKGAGNIFFDINNANIAIGVTVNQYTSTDTPVNIFDNQTVQSTITIPDDGTIADLDLQLDISHTWDADLTVTLTSPSGTVFDLFSAIGGSGDNFSGTYFDDGAADSINSGIPPFSGSFRPVDAFSPLNGTAVVGDWILSISDSATQDQGILNTWSLFVTLDDPDIGPVTDADSDNDEVVENALIGSTVGITAQADDAGDTVTYELINDAGGRFDIDANSGVVTVAGALDFEITGSHLIEVEATSTDGSTSSTQFTVGVLNAPEVESSQVGDGSSQRSTVDQLVVNFDGAVTIGSGAFTVIQLSDLGGATGTTISTSFTTQLVGGKTVATITFNSGTRNAFGALLDGNYQLTIDSSEIEFTGSLVGMQSDYVFGDEATDLFFALYGDIDGNRTINISDVTRFREAFGTSVGDSKFVPAFDYNGDGTLNLVGDRVEFRSRRGKTLSFV